jgi:fatty acid CoA ligase FadD9
MIGTQDERIARRIASLYANDRQFAAATPDPTVIEAARRPGLRLAEVLQTFVDGYADRPALGQRMRELVTDPVTGRTSAGLLPRFETVSYRQLWARVQAIASAWDQHGAIASGDFVATIGFASPDYLTVDLVCSYLGLVSVPLQHTAPVAQLRPIIAEVQPRAVAVGAGYLDLAVESALSSDSLRHLVVFDYQPEVDDHRESLERARRRLHDAGMAVVVESLGEVAELGAALPARPPCTGGSAERLAMILYTSGSTGAPKGAMFTERMVAGLWTSAIAETSETPVFNVNFMPLNHIGGRLPLVTSFQAGGTSFFVAESDLSTLFEDWALARPTEMWLVPRVVDMLFQHYHSAVDRLLAQGAGNGLAEEAPAELRNQVLGGRVLTGFVGAAPLAAEMKAFLDSCLGIHIVDGYGSTEVGVVLKDGVVSRPPVIDYKLVDVPELGYFLTDKPYPRGELLVKSLSASPGYYKRPEVTAAVFDTDGYYHTGDVVAEIAPDHLAYVDRSKNVLKLAQGEFVAVANLEAVFAGAPWVRQIFVHANSERPNLLAVIVPTEEALRRFDSGALKAALHESLRQTAKLAELQSYEMPVDFLVETEPFSPANGLLSGVGKLVRPKLTEHYGQRLEQLYTDLAAAQLDELRALRQAAADTPVIDTVTRAARTVLGSDVDADEHFTDLGGDSLSALSFSNLLADIFAVDVPVGVIISPANTLRGIADHIQAQRASGAKRPTFAAVHGRGATQVRARDLTLEKFIDATTLAQAPMLPRTTDQPNTVVLTGANGWLGRFLTLEWLQRLSQTGGTLITIVRGSNAEQARARLQRAFDSGHPALLRRFQELAADHLQVLASDIGEPDLGLDKPTWARLAEHVDLIVHPAALVNHLLPYTQLFGPNVVGTAELIRLAITTRIKPITYLSTVAVAMTVEHFVEDADIRQISPVRPISDTYANGYANSKWAGEVLLRETHDLCGLPVAVFRSDMILAHTRYVGQLNVPDTFTRLIFSLLVTGIAPRSFYHTGADGSRSRAHYDGLPVDFVAEAITTIGSTEGFHSFDVMNPHDDGISLDTFVDWLIDAGHQIERIDDYATWLARFETALRALPEKQRQHSVLPLLHAYVRPDKPLRGAIAPTEVFDAAVRAAKVGGDKGIPHLSAQLMGKYVSDLKHLGMV